MSWKSFAQWPEGTIAGTKDNISEDLHHTQEQAIAVTRMLRRDGFGGYGKIFPVSTWVKENAAHSPAQASE